VPIQLIPRKRKTVDHDRRENGICFPLAEREPYLTARGDKDFSLAGTDIGAAKARERQTKQSVASRRHIPRKQSWLRGFIESLWGGVR
jgi:hypothetical protein